jgi:hypothetical protein
MSRKETEAQRAILDYLKLIGIFCWRANNIASPGKDGAFRKFAGMPGMADILGILPGGRFLAIEVKSETGKATPNQLKFGEAINRNGGLWFEARSVADVQKQNSILAGHMDICNFDTERELASYLARHVDVNLIHTDENGEWLWAIEVAESPGFWLDSYPEKKRAIAFCKRHQLKIIREG